jgi:hypothetical protein
MYDNRHKTLYTIKSMERGIKIVLMCNIKEKTYNTKIGIK